MDFLLSPLLVAAAALVAVVGIASLSPGLRRTVREWAPAFMRASARASLFERRLAESRERFQDFAEASSDWFWEMGPDLRFTYMSERLRDVLGFDPAYPIGKRREDLSDTSLEPEHWARHFEDLRQHRPFRDFTYKLRLPNQQLRYISVSGKPVYGRRGAFLGYRGTGRDVTAAVVGAQALKQQTELVLSLIEKLPFGVTLFDANLNCIALNERFLELFDMPRGRLKPGDHFEKFIRLHSETGDYGSGDLEKIVRNRLTYASSREPSQFERHTMGGRVVEIRHIPLPDGGLLRTHLEVTQSKRAEARLRESEVRFRDFAESSTDWLWEQDADLRFTYLSHGAMERFGLTREDFIGRRRQETQPLGVTDEQWRDHLADLDARRPFRNFRMSRLDIEGRQCWCTISGWPLFDERGAFTGYRGTGRDITREVAAEQRAAQAQNRLSAAVEVLSDGLAFFDIDDRLITCNEAFRRLIDPVRDVAVPGAQFEDMLRAAAAAGHFPQAASDPEAFVRARMAYHRNPSGVVQRQLADGTWFQIREQRLSDGSTALVASDITDIKRQQAEFAQKSATLEAMLGNMSEGISVYDRDKKLVTFNRRWQEMLRLPDSLAQVGTLFSDVLYFMGRRGDFGSEPLDDAVARRVTQGYTGTAHRFAKWYSSGRFIELRRTPMPDGGFISVMADLTELKSAEERFRDFAEATSDWFWEQDEELRFTFMSQGVYDKSGVPADAHIGRTRQELKPLGVSEEQWVAHNAQLDARRPFRDFRMQRVDPHGRLRTLAISGKPLFDAKGQFKGYRGSGADITDRVEAEARAKLAQARFGSAIESLSDALAIFDSDDRLVMCNQAYREVVGGSDEVVKPGARFEDILRFNLERGFLRSVQDKEAFIAQRLAQHRNPGEPIQLQRHGGGWLQIREQRLADGGIAVIGTDITATKEHEQEIFEKSEILQRTLANMGEGIIVFDRDLKLLAWNDRVIDLIELPRDFLRVGLDYQDFLRPQAERGEFGNESVDEAIRKRVERAQSPQPFSIDRRRPNGRYLAYRRNPMPDGGFVALYSDVTERRRAEDGLREAKEAAEIANRTKSEFLANMSHELRTPLNAIIGFSEIIQKEMFGPIGSGRYKEYAVDIYESGTHLLNLINDILDVSKAEAGKIELQESQVLVKDLIDASLRLIMPRAREAGVSLIEPETDRLPPLRADERRLKQVLINLLSNAVKFTPSGGRVTLEAAVNADRGLTIRVIDTGIGMEAADIPKALEPFGQVDSRLSRKYEGTGLGLPLSKALVELHGGKLDIQSEPGVGTTVSVVLPAARVAQDLVATIHRLKRQSR